MGRLVILEIGLVMMKNQPSLKPNCESLKSMKSLIMSRPDEYWVEQIQAIIEQPYDPYIKALHIYAEVVLKALDEIRGEYEMLVPIPDPTTKQYFS